MESLTLRICDDAGTVTCALCGLTATHRPGPRLFLADSDNPVCRECARKNEPRLADLLDLASIAEKVGRSQRHLLTPPMECLLELARAADNYNQSTRRQACVSYR